jgi:hypothetical protein
VIDIFLFPDEELEKALLKLLLLLLLVEYCCCCWCIMLLLLLLLLCVEERKGGCEGREADDEPRMLLPSDGGVPRFLGDARDVVVVPGECFDDEETEILWEGTVLQMEASWETSSLLLDTLLERYEESDACDEKPGGGFIFDAVPLLLLLW